MSYKRRPHCLGFILMEAIIEKMNCKISMLIGYSHAIKYIGPKRPSSCWWFDGRKRSWGLKMERNNIWCLSTDKLVTCPSYNYFPQFGLLCVSERLKLVQHAPQCQWLIWPLGGTLTLQLNEAQTVQMLFKSKGYLLPPCLLFAVWKVSILPAEDSLM